MVYPLHCAEECPKLENPRYGKVVVRGYTPDSLAYYSCDYGYKLHGSGNLRKCLHDGRWNGDAPTCIRSKY